ncbi:MAG: ABC transporter ATP-binding protein, partial [Proteobacteria bacterium]|nr:ABC transporter ATP-binding protein [Pseudomonadota bacterium]
SVLRNVTFGLAGMGRAEAQLRAREVLGQVGMVDYCDAFPHVLSGGQQKRVALARALAPRPKVMLFDEPFSGLDAQLRSQIREETLHLMKDSGTTTLIVTHDPEEAMYMADRIAVLHQGHIVQVGTPVELYRQPNSAFVTNFFSSVNRLNGVVEAGAVAGPFGAVAADGIADGTAVEVLIRPEAILISRIGDDNAGNEEGHSAHIITTRALRRGNFIHLCLGEFEDTHLHFHSRVPSRFVLEEGEAISVRLDPAQTFVFPVGD